MFRNVSAVTLDTKDSVSASVRYVCLHSSGLLLCGTDVYPVFVFSGSSKKEDGMKVEYLGDGSLDRHGVNPGDRGIPSVLQAGSCKRGRIFFHKSPL